MRNPVHKEHPTGAPKFNVIGVPQMSELVRHERGLAALIPTTDGEDFVNSTDVSSTESGLANRASISVVICSYADWRWDELRDACASVQAQLDDRDELLVVIDHNPDLLVRARAGLTGLDVLPNSGKRGLSGARNTGVEASRCDVVAFLDDDAAARPGWMDSLRAAFEGADVAVAGTSVQPRWEGGLAPRWFPPEFAWVVGCSYRGLPESKSEVRNPIGASMAIRRAVFGRVGGFSEVVGRVGTTPVGCEETEFCIRVSADDPESVIIFDPAGSVDHHVPAGRQTLRYFVRRCYHEGLSKRIVSQMRGSQTALSAERRYVRVTLTAAVLRGVSESPRRPAGLLRACAVVLGLSSTVAGYAVGLMKRDTAAPSARAQIVLQ